MRGGEAEVKKRGLEEKGTDKGWREESKEKE